METGDSSKCDQETLCFKPITWYAKSRTTKSIPGLYALEFLSNIILAYTTMVM